jgi:hypothetical protein
MYQNLNITQATALLMEDEYAHWSWSGAVALVEYLEDLEDSTDTKIEFDTVGIRCEYSEYESVREAAEHYDFIPPDDEDDKDAIEAAALNYLEERTTVIQFEGGVIIQQF